MRPTFPTRLLLVGAIALAAPPCRGATVSWPGSPGCTGTLQACIDLAASGDTVLVLVDAPPTARFELVLRRGIRLVGVTGTRQPPRVPAIRIDVPDASTRITVADLTTDDLRVDSSAPGARLELELRGLQVTQRAVLALQSQQSLRLRATGNVFRGSSLGLSVSGAARVDAVVSGNRFDGPRRWDASLRDYVTTCGIAITTVDQAAATALLEGNTIRCDFDAGIHAGGFSSVPLVVRADNQLIALQDPPSTQPLPLGKALELFGNIEFRLAHATIDGGVLRLGCANAGCGTPRIKVFNSILSNLGIAPAGTLRIEHGGNLHHRSQPLTGIQRGANRTDEPRFRGDGDYRLRGDSPAIGLGLDLADEGQFGEGGAVPVDLDGLPRAAGRRPDAGAHGHGDIEGTARIPAGAGGVAMPARFGTGRALFTSAAPYAGADRNTQVLSVREPGAGWIALRAPDASSGPIDVHAWQPSALVVEDVATRTGATAEIGITSLANGRIAILREAGVDGSPVFGQTLGLYELDGEILATAGTQPGALPIPRGLPVASLLLPPGAHAFEQTAGPEHLTASGEMRIAHRDLDDSPCAPVHVTPVHPFAGSFRLMQRDVAGRKSWYLRRSDAIGGIVPGQRFHVFVHREALSRCALMPLFADGFE